LIILNHNPMEKEFNEDVYVENRKIIKFTHNNYDVEIIPENLPLPVKIINKTFREQVGQFQVFQILKKKIN
jgi:hypothetical protein